MGIYAVSSALKPYSNITAPLGVHVEIHCSSDVVTFTCFCGWRVFISLWCVDLAVLTYMPLGTNQFQAEVRQRSKHSRKHQNQFLPQVAVSRGAHLKHFPHPTNRDWFVAIQSRHQNRWNSVKYVPVKWSGQLLLLLRRWCAWRGSGSGSVLSH